MSYVACRHRTFPYRMSVLTFYPTYLRWLAHLSERLGWRNTLEVWKSAFAGYDDTLLASILSAAWHPVEDGDAFPMDDRVNELAAGLFPTAGSELTIGFARELVENTPPISHILRQFSDATVERTISAYDVLHLRFDGLACLAQALIETYQKQGEFIVYDLVVKDRLASSQGEAGSVQEFIEDFTAAPKTAMLVYRRIGDRISKPIGQRGGDAHTGMRMGEILS